MDNERFNKRFIEMKYLKTYEGADAVMAIDKTFVSHRDKGTMPFVIDKGSGKVFFGKEGQTHSSVENWTVISGANGRLFLEHKIDDIYNKHIFILRPTTCFYK